MLIWVFSTVLLFAALLVLVKGLFPTASIELRLAARFLTASVVTFIAAFVDFVVMVNIWEDLGFGL
jgi:hypothetical protein